MTHRLEHHVHLSILPSCYGLVRGDNHEQYTDPRLSQPHISSQSYVMCNPSPQVSLLTIEGRSRVLSVSPLAITSA